MNRTARGTTPPTTRQLQPAGDHRPPAVPYTRLSLAEKQAHAQNRLRAPAMRCPWCGVQTTAAYLLRHVRSTCTGRLPPHPLSRWITVEEVVAMGASLQTLRDWERKGRLLWRGARRCRVYLESDVVLLVAMTIAVPASRNGGAP